MAWVQKFIHFTFNYQNSDLGFEGELGSPFNSKLSEQTLNSLLNAERWRTR